MSVISSYQGDLPERCSICFEDEGNRKFLLQTNCCKAHTVATKIIPQTYHIDCIKEWAKTRPGNTFNCMRCSQLIPKEDLFSKREIIIQKIMPYAEWLKIMASFFLGIGYMTENNFQHEYGIITRIGINSILTAIVISTFAIIQDKFDERLKFIAVAIVPSILASNMPLAIHEMLSVKIEMVVCLIIECFFLRELIKIHKS